jgi:hypothetical protein
VRMLVWTLCRFMVSSLPERRGFLCTGRRECTRGRRRHRSAGRLWWVFLLPFCLNPCMGAKQDASASDPLRLFVETYGTLQEVRVVDPEGDPVTGLHREDFQVRVNGVPRPLIYFEERRDVPLSLAILVDIGSSMDEEALRTAKETILHLVHLLDPEDEVLIGVYHREVDFLTELIRDRYRMVEAVDNISPGGRSGFWSRFASGFGTSAMTGPAIDEALLRLKGARNSLRVVLVLSSAFGNLGVATAEHLSLAGARFFGVSWDNRMGDAFNLWGDRRSLSETLRKSGGFLIPGGEVLDRLRQLPEVFKGFYLLAHAPRNEDEEEEPEFSIPERPEYRVYAAPRRPGRSSFY